MNKKGIVVVSFGTAEETVLERTIGALETEIAEAFPDWAICRAITSTVVRKKLLTKGIPADTPEEALEKLHREGVRDVLVLPTFLAPGGEFRRLLQHLEPEKNRFAPMDILSPLLAETESITALAWLLEKRHASETGEAVLFMGHGTEGEGNDCYRDLETAFSGKGLYVALLKGKPSFENTLDRILAEGYRAVRLVPLMLSAGAHAAEHLADTGKDSWTVRCERAGLKTKVDMKGLAEDREFRKLYLRRLHRAAGEEKT